MDSEITKLNKRIDELEKQLKSFQDEYNKDLFSALYIEKRSFSHLGQKLGFFSVLPISQPSSTGETTGASDTTLNNATTFTGNNGSTAYTVLDLVKHLKNIGILKK